MSGEYTRQDFDELVARLKKLEPPTVTDCLGLVIGYTDLLAERDTLAAELVALKASQRCTWSPYPKGWLLFRGSTRIGRVNSGFLGFVGAVEDKIICPRDTREAAMLAVTTALGLPPCEVEGE